MPKLLDTDLESGSCQKCGATRPDIELKSEQGCANCSNLKIISDNLKQSKENESDKEKDLDNLKNLPKLDKFLSLLYDNEVGVVWLGINLNEPKCDPLVLLFKIDEVKASLLSFFSDWKQRRKRRESIIIQPAKDLVSKIGRKANLVGERVKEMFTLQ